MDEIKLIKGSDGWVARTTIALDLTKVDFVTKRALPMFLEISTGKASWGGIYCSAHVFAKDTGTTIMDVPGDFSKQITRDKKARCTEKTVTAMHEQALEQKDELLDEVKAFYAKKQAA